MEKIIIDKRNGWEYELIGEQYYPTGRVMRDGRLQPETVDADVEPEENNGPKEEIIFGVWAQRHLQYIKQYKRKDDAHSDLRSGGDRQPVRRDARRRGI